MFEVNQRIRELRRELGISQDAFAARIGLTRGAITNIELNKLEPKKLLIPLICKEFGCDEIWIRTGEGTMFRERSWQEEVAKYVGEVLSSQGAGEEIQQIILEFFAKIPQDMLDEIGEKAKEVLDNNREK